MAYKKNNRKGSYKKKRKRACYSFIDRMTYYKKKSNSGSTGSERDYADGYLQGMRGVVDHSYGTDAQKVGNDAGLRFWRKLTQTKI